MAVEFAKGLVVTEVLSADALERALFVAASNDSPLEHALLDTNALTAERLELELGRADAPVMHEVQADIELLDRLPAGLCTRLLVVPLRFDERSNTVDLAVVNAFDTHAAEEIAFHLGANVVAVRASLEQVEAALHDRPSYTHIMSARAPQRLATHLPMRHETPPPDPMYAVRRTPIWGTDTASTGARSEPSEIPIPLTRRRSTFAPALDPVGDESVASLTYSRLGGGLSLPDAALVRARSSVPAARPAVADEGLRIDSLPAAAVEVAHARAVHPSFPPRREPDELASPTFVRRADLPPPPGAEQRPLTLSLIPPSISLREPPSTTRDGLARPPPPIAAEFGRTPSTPPAAPSHRPAPISVRAPSMRPSRASTAPGAFLPAESGQVLAALKAAPDRDAVLGLVLAGARVVARRVALFVVRRGAFVGWTCSPEIAAPSAIHALTIPADAPTVLAWASAEGTYLGPLDPSTHGSLMAALRTVSREVAAVPIRVHGRTAVVVLADELGDTLIATRRLEEIASVAGEALARIVRAAKK